MARPVRTQGSTQRVGAFQRNGIFKLVKVVFFENLLKYHEMPWVYPSLIINGAVCKLKLALLVLFFFFFAGGGQYGFCHCSSWFDKDYQKGKGK